MRFVNEKGYSLPCSDDDNEDDDHDNDQANTLTHSMESLLEDDDGERELNSLYDQPFFIPGIGLVQSTESLYYSPIQSQDESDGVIDRYDEEDEDEEDIDRHEEDEIDRPHEEEVPCYSPWPPKYGVFTATRKGTS